MRHKMLLLRLSKWAIPSAIVLALSASGNTSQPAHSQGGGCVAPPAGLVSWWPGDGNANDIWGGNPGTLMGGTTFGAGVVGQAFGLDGVDDYVNIPDDSSLSPSTITVDAWFYATDISGQLVPPLLKKSHDRDGYALEMAGESGDHLAFWVSVSGVGWVRSDIVYLSTNTWYHVAGTYDGSDIKVYLNGQPQGTPTSVTGSIEPISSPLYIGSDPSSQGRFFKGLIDEVEIYNRALSASEIQAIYTAGSAGKCKSAAVGGMAELPDAQAGAAIPKPSQSAPDTLAIAGLAAGSALLLVAAGWYARRRWRH